MFPIRWQPPVVVGVDGEPASLVALDWAIDEASRRHLPLRILYADPFPPSSGPTAPETGSAVRGAGGVIVRAVARAHALTPWLDVTGESATARPARALVEASHRAACIIVGARGRSPLLGALLGTTSAEIATHAACPVVVVRQLPEIEPRRPGVVVGADGSEVSAAAVGYAFAQAADRQLPLTVVHVWSPGVGGDRGEGAREVDRQTLVAREQALAAEEVAGWEAKYPDVVVRQHVRSGRPVKALVAESRGAELLVVGSRGRAGFAGMLLGSVSQGALQHAHCPVAVVRSLH